MATSETRVPPHLFDTIWSKLEGLGYRGELLQKSYRFEDWFSPGNPQRVAQAAAFGRTPLAYDSACFAVLTPQSVTGPEFISQYRALGSPLAFEIESDNVNLWTVGKSAATTKQIIRFSRDQLDSVFRDHENQWSPKSVLRAKNIAPSTQLHQQDLFIDTGLIPALEAEIMPKLDVILRRVLFNAEQAHIGAKGTKPDPKKLFRLVFRLLAAKVLKDRGVNGFRSLAASDADSALEMVGRYYNEPANLVLKDPATRETVAGSLWESLDFRNLSVEVLAYIYENTLVDGTSRDKYGTHGTPHSIARYMVRRLPIEDVPEDKRVIVEPCSGHGIFLVAALQRLRELLDTPDMPAAQRHRYFVRMLRGFELDAFAWEVSKLCLMLADFPNHNGWKLENEDVFTSQHFLDSVREARVILCNPPFGRFTAAERNQYENRRSVYKPAEIIHRVLDNLPPDGMMGFVLPFQFVDGQGYRDVRRRVAESFESAEIVDLPEEGIFRISRHKAVLLLARGHLKSEGQLPVNFVEVADKDRDAFIHRSAFTRQDHALKSPDEAEKTLAVTPLTPLWEFLSEQNQLSGIAEIHRGIAWHQFSPETCYSREPRPGFVPGFGKANESELQQYATPNPIYLSVDPSNLRRGFNHHWDQPKVFVNAGRISMGRWRYAAFLDETGIFGSQRFHGVWPKKGSVSLELLAALLNSPLAAAFVATHEKGRDITKETLQSIPVPAFTEEDDWTIRQLVQEYIARVTDSDEQGPEGYATALDVLCEIDTNVLTMYGLPLSLAQDLLTFFRGHNRPTSFAKNANVELCVLDELTKLNKIPTDKERDERETWLLLRKELAEGTR